PSAFYPLSLHDALPISAAELETSGAVGCFVEELLSEPPARAGVEAFYRSWLELDRVATPDPDAFPEYSADTLEALRAETLRFARSEEHTSELQSRENLV